MQDGQRQALALAIGLALAVGIYALSVIARSDLPVWQASPDIGSGVRALAGLVIGTQLAIAALRNMVPQTEPSEGEPVQRMSFHEKEAWVVVNITLLLTPYYVWLVETASPETGFWNTLPTVRLIINFVVAMVIATVIAMIIIVTGSGDDAETDPDERERLIALKGGRYGYWALNAFMIGIFWLLLTDASRAAVFHALAFATFAATVVEYGSQILRHRLGS